MTRYVIINKARDFDRLIEATDSNTTIMDYVYNTKYIYMIDSNDNITPIGAVDHDMEHTSHLMGIDIFLETRQTNNNSAYNLTKGSTVFVTNTMSKWELPIANVLFLLKDGNKVVVSIDTDKEEGKDFNGNFHSLEDVSHYLVLNNYSYNTTLQLSRLQAIDELLNGSVLVRSNGNILRGEDGILEVTKLTDRVVPYTKTTVIAFDSEFTTS